MFAEGWVAGCAAAEVGAEVLTEEDGEGSGGREGEEFVVWLVRRWGELRLFG